VFVDDDCEEINVPVWAMKVSLSADEIEIHEFSEGYK
jgi:hypothetical protein